MTASYMGAEKTCDKVDAIGWPKMAYLDVNKKL